MACPLGNAVSEASCSVQEVSVPIAFAGALPAGNELHGGVDQEGVTHGFQFQGSDFFEMRILGLESISP